MTSATLPAIIAILVDDTATLTVEENKSARPLGVKGPFFSQTYTVNGSALWNPKSYQEFDIPLPPGRKYNLTLNYANLANLTKQYRGKTDVDGVSVYVCLMPLEITTETIAEQPANRDRKKIGIGEEVKLGIKIPADAQVTWSLKDDSSGQLSHPENYTANQVKFTASALEKPATVEATLTNYGNAKASVNFDVITPKSITFEKVPRPENSLYAPYDPSGITVESNGIKMEFDAQFYFGPDDVCFYNVQAGESAADPNLKGWFKLDPLYARMKHPAWIGGEPQNGGDLTGIVVKGKGTQSKTPDHVRAGAEEPPDFHQRDPNDPDMPGGRFEWTIKWKYRLKWDSGDGTPFGVDVVQWFELYPGNQFNGFSGKGGKGKVKVPTK